LHKKIQINSYVFSIHSQCWGNDLWMSCTGNTRNREFGTLIGKGYSPVKALNHMKRTHKTVEGLNTIEALTKFKLSNQFPILQAIYDIVINNKNPKKAIWKLMKSNKI